MRWWRLAMSLAVMGAGTALWYWACPWTARMWEALPVRARLALWAWFVLITASKSIGNAIIWVGMAIAEKAEREDEGPGPEHG